MKTVLCLIISAAVVFAADTLLAVSSSLERDNGDLIRYEGFIHPKDSISFYSESSSFKSRDSLMIDSMKIFRNSHLYGEGITYKGENLGLWTYYNNDGSVKLKEYTNSKGRLRKREKFRYNKIIETEQFYPKWLESLFNDYQWGIQHPTNIDVAHPTGFTISSLNLHFEIPMPHIADVYRPIVVLANEAGMNGYAFRAGLSPYINKDYYVSSVFGFTPVTVNASFTYIFRDNDYENLPEPTPYRWHVGVDADLNFVFGHFRLGAYRLIGPEDDRPWHFMFSVGASPAILAIPFAAQ